jgi:hypothetical protein
MRFIGRHCNVAMLFGGNDQWAPELVMNELRELVRLGMVSDRISVTHEPLLQHDYVTDPKTSVSLVVDFVVEQVREIDRASRSAPQSHAIEGARLRSKL